MEHIEIIGKREALPSVSEAIKRIELISVGIKEMLQDREVSDGHKFGMLKKMLGEMLEVKIQAQRKDKLWNDSDKEIFEERFATVYQDIIHGIIDAAPYSRFEKAS